MHKGYVRRTIFLWGSSLIWVLLGIFFFSGTVKGYIGGESLYKAGDIYHLNDAGTSVAIRVLDIDSEALTYDGKEYYLVKHENGVTPLQASAKDIQQLLDLKKENPEGWEPLKESNIYLNVRVTPAVTKGRRGSTTVHIPAVLLEAFATQYKKGTLLPVGDSTLNEEYEAFDKEFPRYTQNMKALLMDADFNDPKLKVLVKDHKFVCYNKDFRVIKLREVRNVEVRRQKAKSSVTYAIDFAFGGNKNVTIQLKNRPENVRQLVDYLNEKEGTKISLPFQW